MLYILFSNLSILLILPIYYYTKNLGLVPNIFYFSYKKRRPQVLLLFVITFFVLLAQKFDAYNVLPKHQHHFVVAYHLN